MKREQKEEQGEARFGSLPVISETVSARMSEEIRKFKWGLPLMVREKALQEDLRELNEHNPELANILQGMIRGILHYSPGTCRRITSAECEELRDGLVYAQLLLLRAVNEDSGCLPGREQKALECGEVGSGSLPMISKAVSRRVLEEITRAGGLFSMVRDETLEQDLRWLNQHNPELANILEGMARSVLDYLLWLKRKLYPNEYEELQISLIYAQLMLLRVINEEIKGG